MRRNREIALFLAAIAASAVVAGCTTTGSVAATPPSATHVSADATSGTGATSPSSASNAASSSAEPSLPPPPHAKLGRLDWIDEVTAASDLGRRAGLRVAVAVLDTATGVSYSAGDTGQFGTASVVKVMIAAYLLDNGEMSGDTETLAYSMITRSDDDAADVLWGRAGGASLEPWIAAHYHVIGLGSPNGIPGRWGNTQVTAVGLTRLYAKLKADPGVWPWLGNAMHHMQPVAKDGTNQRFGLPAVVAGAAVKQGWADGSADDPRDAVINTTGYVEADRYVVVVLTEGHHNNSGDDSRGLNPAEAATVTAMVRQLELNTL